MGDQSTFDFADGLRENQGGNDPVEDFLLPDRRQHPIYPDTNRTCYFCHVRVAEAHDRWWYTDDKGHFCICHEHRNFVGRHGELSDPKRRPTSPLATARYLKTSIAPNVRQRGRKQEAERLKVNDSNELGDGEVTPEVAAFLRMKGKM